MFRVHSSVKAVVVVPVYVLRVMVRVVVTGGVGGSVTAPWLVPELGQPAAAGFSLPVTVETDATVGDAAAGLELAAVGVAAPAELDVCAAAFRARARKPNARMVAIVTGGMRR